MKVYALIHSEMEGSTLRGIYARREDAERDLPVQVVEYHATRSDEGLKCMTFSHSEYCCDVDEIEVRDTAIGATLLPQRTIGQALIPVWIADQLKQSILSDNPYTKIALRTD